MKNLITNKKDLIIAFFPCIYFTGSTNPCYYTLENINYRCLTTKEKFAKMIERSQKREFFYEILLKLCSICYDKKIRLIIENPFQETHFLNNNFLKRPDIYDKNRLIRGDFFKKPTGYWFFNCEPTTGFSYQNDKKQQKIFDKKSGKHGFCSEERSMISSDYARNFICDFIIGKKQKISQLTLF